jgi:hypothetical protein
MENNFQSFLEETKEILKNYLEARINLLKLHLAGKLSKALGVFFTLIMASFLFFFIIIFLGMVVGFWMGSVTGSLAIGFLISTGIFTLILGILVIFRKPLFQVPIVNVILSVLMEEFDDEEREFTQNMD